MVGVYCSGRVLQWACTTVGVYCSGRVPEHTGSVLPVANSIIYCGMCEKCGHTCHHKVIKIIHYWWGVQAYMVEGI